MSTSNALPTSPARPSWLVRHPAEWRQIGIVATYWALLFSMYFVPACRNALFFLGACYFSFLNSVVIHNHMHAGVFHSRRLNMLFRCVLSFGALYPASTNVSAHNLVHHHFEDEGQPDWAAPEHVSFKWNLLNILHFPNVAGPNTFSGLQRWQAVGNRGAFRRQLLVEQVFAFGLTLALLAYDFWGALFFIVLPQLWGARGILRINIIQHDQCDTSTEWNHSRNFVGRAFNWIMCNNGYHTIHHNRAGVHWSELHEWHAREVVPRIHPSLDEKSMVWYLFRTYVLNPARPARLDVAAAEKKAKALDLEARAQRRKRAEEASRAEQNAAPGLPGTSPSIAATEG